MFIFLHTYPCPVFRFGRRHRTPRHTPPSSQAGIMSAKAGSGISVMRSDFDASTSTEVDAHEAQWRAGVNRQARPDAASQRRAASLAAAAQAAVDKDMNNIPAQSVVARAAAGGAPSQPTLGTAARACSLSHPTRLHSRPPAPTPSSALRLIAACVAQCRPTRRWPEHDCDASVWAGGAFDSARGCLPALCDACDHC